MLHKKINDRFMEMFEKGEFDDDFINLELSTFIKNKLHTYQHLHVFNLISCVSKNNVTIDGSDTGTGKTYCALAVAKHFGYIPLIICPKSTISIWKDTCLYFNIKPLDIINYENIRLGNITQKNNPYLEIRDDNFFWKFQDTSKIIVIFDEAHKCKNKSTLNSKLLMSLKNLCKMILLSATLCDNPKNFTVYGYMLNFYNDLKKGKKWIENIIKEQDKNKSNIIYKYLFPEKGSRMTMNEIKDNYPMNQICVDCYNIDNKYVKQIDNSYNLIHGNLKISQAESLIKLNFERQKIEEIKIPIILELMEKYLEHNKSIAIFINFRKSLETIRKYLDKNNITHSYIDGTQTLIERDLNINNFQTNKVRIIVCTIQSGGQSINLHDKIGNNPRVSIISPSFSSIDFLQTLGRIYRVGLKSPTLQIIIFCANTIEKSISDAIKTKINFLDKLTDDDLCTSIFK